MAKQAVCPLCVQWRCSKCKSFDWPNCCDDGWFVEPEPYWPDGTVAVITMKEYCERCQKAMDEYFRGYDERA